MGLFDRFRGKVLYFPGCPAKFLVKDVRRRHEQILTELDIEYVKLPQLEVCCGKPALDIGYPDQFKELKAKNVETFGNQKIRKIITSDPFCYFTFKKKYENIEVEHISQTILNNINKYGKKFQGKEITFYDTCNPYKLKELYDVPRNILTSLGFKLVELQNCRETGMCCGKAIESASPKVAQEMAKSVLNQVKTKQIITTSPDCYLYLKQQQNKDIEILELSEVLT